MSSREESLQAIKFVLVNKIYPTKPILMRNDTLAASIVVKYAAVVIHERDISHRKNSGRTLFQNEAVSVYYDISPLRDLSQETVRKYIAQLWRMNEFDAFVKFGKVKGFLG